MSSWTPWWQPLRSSPPRAAGWCSPGACRRGPDGDHRPPGRRRPSRRCTLRPRREWCRAGYGLESWPDLIKPNGEELGEILGRDPTTLAEVLDGCTEAMDRGAAAVICSLGEDMAVLVDQDGRWLATGPRVHVLITVGAGDSRLAGFLHTGGSGPQALRVGVAWATTAVGTPGTGVPRAELIDASRVEIRQLP